MVSGNACTLPRARSNEHPIPPLKFAIIGTFQANVSRTEHHDDLYLSMLSSYVAALGGHLEVTAVFPDGAPPRKGITTRYHAVMPLW
ncbi:hypothetical protein NITHO_1560008 [Nitrolancea hollandica Lb]|uniref:Uncharacterized protein n=1 Tax=Nitrolancea hollandica Lb TaxID=1129897 RepID=I4EDL8_9BACT|nr:hypothetical protein NITHO_1560008 [Nitrolancea hollandica Lb]